MAVKDSYPDTVVFDPIQSGFYDTEEAVTLSNFSGGRLMNRLPHTDGLLMRASGLQINSANLVLTRTGNGNWSYQRTAAGAESYFLRTTLGDLLRTGEVYNYGGFGSGQNVTAGPKGIAVIDMFAILNIGVVALTAATLRLGKSIYPLAGAAAAAPVQTDLVAATAIATATNGAGLFLTNKVAVPAPVFSTDDLGLVEIELAITMANTGTVAVAGLGAHVSFNFT
jgi:hypothetical protein